MQRRISIWFYWSSVFLAVGTCCSAAAFIAGAVPSALWAFVTPVGGVSSAGWALMLVGAIRLKRKGVSHE
ncbi:MAG: hypothetical protein ACLRP3_08860 [Escherichia sp.]